jgi:hypothetical protein
MSSGLRLRRNAISKIASEIISHRKTASLFPIGVLKDIVGIPPIIGRARLEITTRHVPTLVLDSSLAFARIEIQANNRIKRGIMLRYGLILVRLTEAISFPGTSIKIGTLHHSMSVFI